MQCSSNMRKYFDLLTKQVNEAYELARMARKKGFDPEDDVDIPLANDIAERVEGLVGSMAPQIIRSGIAQEIRKLEAKYSPGDWRVALEVSEAVAKQRFCAFETQEKAIEIGIRVGLAYITLGIVSAPLEGFVDMKVKKTRNGKNYIACYYAGPIRAAGGTSAAVSVIIADYLRRVFGYEAYDPTDEEIERYVVEIDSYHNVISRLQYLPTSEEVVMLVKNIPIEITGDPTTKKEVIIHKDLPRVGTPNIRGGMCLVLAEGIAQKSGKMLSNIKSWGKDFGLSDWMWLEDFIKFKKSQHTTEKKEQTITPNYIYIEDAVAGRPIFSYPMRKGGFRIRYGRSRISGLAATSINPATMAVCSNFIATGSQMKIERPGKATAVTPCDTISGPVVKLSDGAVVTLNTVPEYNKVKDRISEILFLGDILISYGDFAEQKHKLVPSPYVEEWWALELQDSISSGKISKVFLQEKVSADIEKLMQDPINTEIDIDDAVKISEISGIPLHPRFTFFYSDVKAGDIKYLIEKLKTADIRRQISVDDEPRLRRILQDIYIQHAPKDDKIIIEHPYSTALLYNLGYLPNHVWPELAIDDDADALTAINKLSQIRIMSRSGIYLGARMGRPEKAKMRKMKGSPHCLFPVAQQGGRMRNVNAAYEKGYVEAEFPIFTCRQCNIKMASRVCPKCGSQTIRAFRCAKCGKITESDTHCGRHTLPYESRSVDIKQEMNAALKRLGVQLPEVVKGVRGLTNKYRIPEQLEKGILRAINDVYVNKDGTIRYDAIELPITHFKPIEVGTSVERLIELGYTHDYKGNFLEDDDQLLELKPQDIILPDCTEWTDVSAPTAMIKVCSFIDELLQKLYGLKPYYHVKSKEDLIGHLIIGLAPHTSAGILGRIIGFSRTQGYFAHPYFHAAMRRNADGDESSILMLLDGLINFSRQYLPDSRGSRAMDAPLVLTTLLDPNEVDNEVHNMDIAFSYPLSFYNATLNYPEPGDIKIEQVRDRLKKDGQYEGLGFTHNSSDINMGTRVSAYKTLVTMDDKVKKQMELAEKIRAVDKMDVARAVIEKHFIRDIKGNLRRYSSQEFRCIDCNIKYRRLPLSGRCENCGGKLVLTVSEGTVNKYLEPSLYLARTYNVPAYITQTLDILKRRIESIFGKEKEKQTGLVEFGSSA